MVTNKSMCNIYGNIVKKLQTKCHEYRETNHHGKCYSHIYLVKEENANDSLCYSFSLCRNDSETEIHALSDLINTTLIDFYSNYCPDCREHNEELKSYDSFLAAVIGELTRMNEVPHDS